MKILLIGNCQVTPLAKVLSAADPSLACEALEVWKMTKEECDAVSIDDYDAVVAQPLMSPHYGVLSHDALCQNVRGKVLLFIHNLHFGGLVPDCTYVGPLGKRISGPMGTYHSSIVLNGFLSDISVMECTNRLNEGKGIEPKKEWNKSVEALKVRESFVSVPFVDELMSYLEIYRCFHVFNHPNAFLIERYAEKILSLLLKQPMWNLKTRQPDLLEVVGTWPIYSWVTDALGLPYSESGFKNPKMSPSVISHREFVERSYKIYRNVSKEYLIV